MRRLLIDATPLIKTLELTTKSALGGELLGSYRSRFKGSGLEFEGYKDYLSGDDASRIDWKASFRTNKLIVKEYAEERNLDIFFLIDVSNSMIYTTGKKLKAEYVGELVISLSYLMIKNQDHVGLAMFTDKIVKQKAPKGGNLQYYEIIESLLNPQNYGGDKDFKKALEFTFDYIKPKSMLIIITDFISIKPDWQELLKNNSRRFDIITFMIRDPADLVIPKSQREVLLKDPFSNKRISLRGEKVRERYAEHVKQQEKNIATFFTDLGISFLRLDTSKSFTEGVITLFKERRLERKSKWK